MLRTLIRRTPQALLPFVLIALAPIPTPGSSPAPDQPAETTEEPATSGTAHPACEPSPETRALLDGLQVSEDCAREDACVRAKIEQTRRLLDERPDDVDLHLHLQSLVRYRYRGEDQGELEERLRDRYRQRAEAHPESALAHFLHAWMSRGDERKELARRAVEADPGFPWGHLSLATAWLQDRDEGIVFEHLGRFLELCPGRAQEALVRGRFLPDHDFWRPRLPALRQALREADSPRRQMPGFSVLWGLEFQIHPTEKHAAVRERVREDLELLRRMGDPDLPGWWQLVGEGYEALGDPEAVARFEEEVLEAAPCSSQAVQIRLRRWRDQHGLEPMQEDRASPEVLRATLEATGRWLEECPAEYRYSTMRISTVRRLGGELSDERFLEEIERHLAVWEKNEHRYRSVTTPWGRMAEALLDRELEPRRAVALAERELERTRSEIEEKRREGSRDSLPEEIRLGVLRMDHHRLASHNTLLARARFAAGDPDGAREAIAAAERALAEVRTMEATHPDALHPPYYDELQSGLLEVLAEQARREERTADAFAHLRRAARLQPNEKEERELRERAEELWRELGGTDDGWRALGSDDGEQVAEAEEEGIWQRWEQTLPDFALNDLRGRTWKPEDLAGQAVLINFWATWCGPCRLELPHVQELQQRLADRPGITVVTLNADSNPGLIQPFLEEEGYRFPVLLASDFVIEELGGIGLPTTWIVDPSGVIRMRQRGYDPDHADTWTDRALSHLEAVLSEPNPEAASEPASESPPRVPADTAPTGSR